MDVWKKQIYPAAIEVVNRYSKIPIAKAGIKKFGLKKGAIVPSVSHDSHNILAVGVDDVSLAETINVIIEVSDGISCINDNHKQVLPLPVAGLMSNENGYTVAKAYTAIDAMSKQLWSTLSAPFMTLSFMALWVMPHLKISYKGLFDGDSFGFV